MKLALIGYGSMGTLLHEIAQKRGHEVPLIIDPLSPSATKGNLDLSSLKNIDLAIDFSSPQAVLNNIEMYCATKTNALIGTTGWYDVLPKVKNMVHESKIAFLWGSNFSVGVNLYFRVIEEASKLFCNVPAYDIWGMEVHHHNKAESPSGTAQSIANIIRKNIPRKTNVVYEKLDRKIEPQEFHFASVRGGPVNFEHKLCFDSKADCVSITHSARDRSGYAEGAILGAEWLAKQGAGYFELENFMASFLA